MSVRLRSSFWRKRSCLACDIFRYPGGSSRESYSVRTNRAIAICRTAGTGPRQAAPALRLHGGNLDGNAAWQ